MSDTESNMRAQLDAQRILIERFESALRGKESENAELRGEVARLTRRLSVVEDQLHDVSHKRRIAEEFLSVESARCIRFENEAVLLQARITHAEKRIAENLCRCECMHEPHEHGADCDPCPACRVYAALRGDA